LKNGGLEIAAAKIAKIACDPEHAPNNGANRGPGRTHRLAGSGGQTPVYPQAGL